jgi:hypothetical protein
MISAFIGLPGTGKTLGMVHNACKALKEGRQVISNLPIVDIEYGTKRVATYTADIGEAIRTASNALICIDEASIVLPNHYWDRLPFDLLIRFAQVRKYGLDIFYTSQGWHHSVKRLRDLTNYVVKCSNHALWFTYDWIDPEYYDMRIAKHFLKDYIVKTDRIYKPKFKKLYNSYNTFFVVSQGILVGNSVKSKLDL